MMNQDEDIPKSGDRILCRHPFAEHKRAYVTISKVETLLHLYFDCGNVVIPPCTITESRNRAIAQITAMRLDHLRILNPTPYKVSVSGALYDRLHELWLSSSPVQEL